MAAFVFQWEARLWGSHKKNRCKSRVFNLLHFIRDGHEAKGYRWFPVDEDRGYLKAMI